LPRLNPLSKKKWIKFLKFIGCSFIRQVDDHIFYNRSGLKRPVVFQDDKEIAKFIIKSNLRTLGLSTEEYFNILKKLSII